MESIVRDLEQKRVEALRPLLEENNSRWERYMNCQDDTLIGGISDQLNSRRIQEVNSKYDLLIKQALSGGILTCEVKQLCLFSLEGVLLSEKIILGKYGECFVFTQNGETKFVGLSKKQVTYFKKGYITKLRTRNYSYTFSGNVTKNGNFLYSDIVLLSETLTPSTERSFSDGWIDYLYQNSNN